MRRVVVTGLGMVTPLGPDVPSTWRALLAGRSGIRRLEGIDTDALACTIGGQVLLGEGPEAFHPGRVVDLKEQRRYGNFIIFALAAAAEALQDSGFAPSSDLERERTGVLVGSGIGGFPSIADSAVALHTGGPRKVSPYFIAGSLINEAAGVLSIRYGLRGPNHSVVTACATGAHALGDAARLIALGDADVMVAGGTEAAICRLSLAGFSIMRALSTRFNDVPSEASRPWDADRDGFVMAEGAGICVLEDLEHAQRRGARIYAELTGYGLSGDGYHLSAPDPEGKGAERAMRAALARARCAPSDIDYLNAHATSTPAGDPVELLAARRLFGSHIPHLCISSTKSATGHLLGAAGAVEAIFSILALRDQVVPATLNLHDPGTENRDLDLVPHEAKPKRVRRVLSNSFGFGGTNAALVFERT